MTTDLPISPARPPLNRRLAAEFLGTSLLVAPAVGAYIGAAYWFTSSTSFANPAVTIGRLFSDSFAGIAPGSVLPFIGMQVIGGAVGTVLVVALYPRTRRDRDDNADVAAVTGSSQG